MVFILVLPYAGVFVYLIARGTSMHERRIREGQAEEAALRGYAGGAGRGNGTVSAPAELADLRDKGVLSEAEFQQGKPRFSPDLRHPPGPGFALVRAGAGLGGRWSGRALVRASTGQRGLVVLAGDLDGAVHHRCRPRRPRRSGRACCRSACCCSRRPTGPGSSGHPTMPLMLTPAGPRHLMLRA